MSKIDYKKELNSAQFDAATATKGPFLVIAGAGSGKTRVLVYRTAYLVEQGILPEQILLLTFTRRAARQMLERASLALDDRCQNVSGGTFHSFANTILRRYAEHLGMPKSFTILDQDDSESALNSLKTHLGFQKLDKRFPKKQALMSIISASVNKCLDVDAVIYDEYPHFLQWLEHVRQLKREYQKYKKALGLLDYDDLLVFLNTLLQQHENVRRQLSQQYQYIMVDEYQDTNRIQAEIVRQLASEHDNVMVVGDDAQSIYSFRGANFRNIMDFPKHFSGTRTIKLEENYRSSQPILDLTNEVINNASERFAKELFTNKTGDVKPVYVDVAHENSQSRYIVNKIRALTARGVKLHEIAVLFRSGWHSNDLEVELSSQGMPFLKFGGQKFVEAAHIKDVMSFLRVAYNPVHEIAWQRILTMLPGVGAKTAEGIIQRAGQNFSIDEKTAKKVPVLMKLMGLFQETDAKGEAPLEILKRFLDFYYPLLMDQYDDYDKRLNDLQSLERIALRYDSLESFLADMALEPPEKSMVDAESRARNDSHLVLSTIHSAKGLEWHTVFVIYCAEGYLPSYRALDNAQAIEEERRLFYVAATRAKDNLFFLRPQIDRAPRGGAEAGGLVHTRISRFLEEGDILRKYVTIENDRSPKKNPYKKFEAAFDKDYDYADEVTDRSDF